MAGSYTFYAFTGEDFDRTLTWSTSNVPVSQGGTPVNLSAYTAAMTVGTVENFITTTPGANGQITLGGALGTIRLQIPNAVLSTLSLGGNDYRLYITNTAPETSVLLTGTINMR